MGFIYVISEDGNHDYFKVGYSKAPERRLNALQTSNPRKLKILRKFRGTEAEERKLHLRLSGHNVLNEWFRNNEETRSILGVKAQSEKVFCKKQAFTFVAGLYSFMKDKNQTYVSARKYCSLRGFSFDPDFARFAFSQCGRVIDLNYVEHKHLTALFDYVGSEFYGKEPFFTFMY